METVEQKVFDLITLEEARQHLRVGDDASNDALIGSKLEGATDIAESFINRMLRGRIVRLSLRASSVIRMKLTPVNGVIRITDDRETEIPAGDYELIKDEYRPEIRFRSLPQSESLNVELDCGYDAKTLPPAIKMGILLILGTLYDNESDNLVGRSVSLLPLSAERILSPWRVEPY